DDPAAGQGERLAEKIDAAADLLERPVYGRGRAGAGDCGLAAPLAVQPMPADEDVAGHVDLDVEGGRKRRWFGDGGGWWLLGGLAVDPGNLDHGDVGR